MKLSLPTEVQTPTCPVIADSSVLKTLGNTPLIRIKKIGNEFKNVTIFAKAEWKNAGGSVKSRPALKMIEDGEKSGKLTKNKIILDSTSGNTGISYALIGKIKGYKVKLVMPANVCKERKGLMADFYVLRLSHLVHLKALMEQLFLQKKSTMKILISISCQTNTTTTQTGKLIMKLQQKKSGHKLIIGLPIS